MSDVSDKKGPAYQTNSWGAWAANPWSDIVPDGPAWQAALKNAWRRGGWPEEQFYLLFPDAATGDLPVPEGSPRIP